jgi:hypothetical protein
LACRSNSGRITAKIFSVHHEAMLFKEYSGPFRMKRAQKYRDFIYAGHLKA